LIEFWRIVALFWLVVFITGVLLYEKRPKMVEKITREINTVGREFIDNIWEEILKMKGTNPFKKEVKYEVKGVKRVSRMIEDYNELLRKLHISVVVLKWCSFLLVVLSFVLIFQDAVYIIPGLLFAFTVWGSGVVIPMIDEEIKETRNTINIAHLLSRHTDELTSSQDKIEKEVKRSFEEN